MNKRLIAIFLLLAFTLFFVYTFASEIYVDNQTDILTSDQANKLNESIQAKDIKVFVVIRNTIENKELFKNEYIEKKKISNTSALLLISYSKRNASLYLGSNLKSNLTPKEILDRYFVSYAKSGRFYDAIENTVEGIQNQVLIKNNSSSLETKNKSKVDPLPFVVFLAVVIVLFTIIFKIQNRKRIKRNLAICEDKFNDIAGKILKLDDELKYIGLYMNDDSIKMKYDDIVENYSKLQDYYNRLKESYSENLYKAFINVCSILDEEIDGILKVSKENEDKIQNEIEDKRKIDKLISQFKNPEYFKDHFDNIKNFDDNKIIEKYLENLLELDSIITKAKDLSSSEYEVFESNIVTELIKVYEKNIYSIKNSMSKNQFDEINNEYNNILKDAKQSNDINILLRALSLTQKLKKYEDDINEKYKLEKEKLDKLKNEFDNIKREYESFSNIRFYTIDIKISEIEEYIRKNDIKNIESSINDLRNTFDRFKKDYLDCKKLLDDFSSFLEKAKGNILYNEDYMILKKKEDILKENLLECDFDEFKREYVEAEAIMKNILSKNNFDYKDIFGGKNISEMFDGLLPMMLFGMLTKEVFHNFGHHHHNFGGNFDVGNNWDSNDSGFDNSDSNGWSSDGGSFNSDDNTSSW
ncbi:TPM domain-containing protein [Caldicellulosiruptoraceae bacterium PP1]